MTAIELEIVEEKKEHEPPLVAHIWNAKICGYGTDAPTVCRAPWNEHRVKCGMQGLNYVYVYPGDRACRSCGAPICTYCLCILIEKGFG